MAMVRGRAKPRGGAEHLQNPPLRDVGSERAQNITLRPACTQRVSCGARKKVVPVLLPAP